MGLDIQTPGKGDLELESKNVTIGDDGTVTNQAEDYSLTVAPGATEKLPYGKVKDKDGNDQQVDYKPAADGYIFEETACAKNLFLRFKVSSGDDTVTTVTIDSDSSGTIDTIDADGLTSLVVNVNGSPVSSPFDLDVSDTLGMTFDAAGSDATIELSGIYT
jgi:hypothetical protein